MTKIMKGGIAYNSTANMVALTQAEYNSLSTTQKNNGNFYFITDADPSYFSAGNIDYDNTDSGLSATNVQDAIDEVENVVSTSNISNFITLNDLTFPSGTTNEQCIASMINTYGKKTISFGYVLTGDGWYTGMITFHQGTQGGGFLVRMGNGKLWSITYINGTITLYEK